MSGHPPAAADDVERAVVAAARVLRGASDVTLLGHLNPDADALGSALALAGALQAPHRTVRVSFDAVNELAPALLALDTDGVVVPAEQVPAAPPTLVVCDTGAEHRLGALADRVRATRETGGDVLVIDHHAGNAVHGTVHVVEDRAESTSLLALRVLDALGFPLDEPRARCVYAGLVTDTRGFRNAGAQAHRVAARLLEAGVDPAATTRALMDNHPYRWLGMLSEVLAGAELEPTAAQGCGLVHSAVLRSAAEGMHGSDVDSVVDLLRCAEEAEVAAVLKEIGDDRWMVSLRADSALDVAHAARTCGGGGHRFASGFTMEGSRAEVLRRLRAALERAPRLG
ncbi:DHH family phosphoesterase [Salinifilum aidingensis]